LSRRASAAVTAVRAPSVRRRVTVKTCRGRFIVIFGNLRLCRGEESSVRIGRGT
jgi:hypothetical protein